LANIEDLVYLFVYLFFKPVLGSHSKTPFDIMKHPFEICHLIPDAKEGAEQSIEIQLEP
jgi:hypothetical protein